MIKGRNIKVEKSESKGPRKPSTKLFVGNLAEGTTPAQLKVNSFYTSLLAEKASGWESHETIGLGCPFSHEILGLFSGHVDKAYKFKIQEKIPKNLSSQYKKLKIKPLNLTNFHT